MDRKQPTPFGNVSKKVFAELCKAGWSPDRDQAGMASEYARILSSKWITEAAPFIRSLGGLTVSNNLSVGPIPDHALRKHWGKVADVAGSKVVPVASSSYLGDGCLIWVDGSGRYYAVDSEGMIFVGDNMATALEVLLGGESLPEPPPELKDKLTAAYDWNK